MLSTQGPTFADLDTLLHAHGRLVVCTVVRAQGSVPRHVGSRMAVLPGGETFGTVGGGLFEDRVRADALEALAARRSRVQTYDFREVGASPTAFGAICGGNADLFLEVVTMPDHLIIVGGGHCGRALARAAALLQTFQITLLDDRPDFAHQGDLPENVHVEQCAPDFGTLPALVTPEAYVAVVSQGFVSDQAALRQIARLPAAYIGMMGSRKKVRTVLSALADEGIPPEDLARVHAPIGLPIHAETPAEIAVSILAEILAARPAPLS